MNNNDSNKDGIVYLWPTPILAKSLKNYEKTNKKLLELFYRHRDRAQAKPQAVYASRDNLLEVYGQQPAIQQLGQFIAASVFEIAQAVNKPYWNNAEKVNVDLTGLWFQITNDHGFHETHIHGNCSWSGVYYVQAGDSARSKDEARGAVPNGITRFYGPHLDITAGGHGDYGNLYLQDTSWDSYPEDGKLVIFPSHLKHMPFPYAGEKDRVIVSFHAQIHHPEGYKLNYQFN